MFTLTKKLIMLTLLLVGTAFFWSLKINDKRTIDYFHDYILSTNNIDTVVKRVSSVVQLSISIVKEQVQKGTLGDT